MLLFYFVDRDSAACIATCYWLDGPGIESRWWGARFSAPVFTGTGAHPASYTLGAGCFAGVKRPGRGVDHPPHLALTLKNEQGYTATPPLGIRGLFQRELYLTFYLFILYVICKSSVFDTLCKIIVSLKCNNINYYLFIYLCFCFLVPYIHFHGAKAPVGPGTPHYSGFTITLRNTTLGRTPLDEWSAPQPYIRILERALLLLKFVTF